MGTTQQKVNRQPFESINRMGVSLAQKVLPHKMKEEEFQLFLVGLTKKCAKRSWCRPVREYFEVNCKRLYGKYCDHLKTNCLTVGLANSMFDLSELQAIFVQHFKQEVKYLECRQEQVDQQTFRKLLQETKGFLALTWYIQESVKQLGGKENNDFKVSVTSALFPMHFEQTNLSEQCFQILLQLAGKTLKPTITELQQLIKKKKFQQQDINILQSHKKCFKYLYEFRRPTLSAQKKHKYLTKIYENINGESSEKVISALIQKFGVVDYYCDIFILSQLGSQNAYTFRLEFQRQLCINTNELQLNHSD